LPETTLSPAKPPRILSLDIFRGLNIALMIFVNDLSSVHGLPWWTYHAPMQVNVMTYVDMVYPAFLLIVGMSLPLSINARIKRGDGTWQLIGHIVLRSIALITLGLILANGPEGSAPLMHGFDPFKGTMVALLAAFLLWLDYPKTDSPQRRRLYQLLRVIGLLVLIALAALFRQKAPGTGAPMWLSFVYPEILGLIGYTYLLCGLCYIATRRWLWAPLGWFLAYLTLNILSAAHIVKTTAPWWIWPPQNGAQPALVFAGVILTTLFFLEPRCNTFLRKAAPAIAFGIVAAIAAWFLSPLGISKIRATPTWVLYTVAACCAIYPVLYYVCDVKKHIAWTAPFRSAGSNTLLTYLLPDFWYFIVAGYSLDWFSHHLNSGAAGIGRSIVFTALMLALSAVLTRFRIRLQL
jgi:predicted acyltransferase